LIGINACITQPHALPTLRVVNFFLPPETKVPPVESEFLVRAAGQEKQKALPANVQLSIQRIL
jgi:hypothetical protein